MFRAILYVQWKWLRWPLLAVTLAVAAIPLVAARSDFTGGTMLVPLLNRLESAAILYPIAAIIVGWAVAAGIWHADRQGRRVYAMAMPVPRWQFVLLRYQAGLVLVLVPALALLLATILVAVTVQLPPGLHAYPGSVSLRFALASVVAYSMIFAMAAADSTVVAGVLAALVILVLVGPGVAELAGARDPAETLLSLLFSPPGPFAIFAGRWMLFDV